MTDEQIKTINHFLSRPMMYLYELEKKQIYAFINGLQAGDRTIELTANISNLLETRHNIKMDALGWPQQIQIYADNNKISWFDALKLLTDDIIKNRSKNN